MDMNLSTSSKEELCKVCGKYQDLYEVQYLRTLDLPNSEQYVEVGKYEQPDNPI